MKLKIERETTNKCTLTSEHKHGLTSRRGAEDGVCENDGFMPYFQEHCLMGIKGTVRRNQDGHFIHANIDLDIIITEEPEIGGVPSSLPPSLPPSLFPVPCSFLPYLPCTVDVYVHMYIYLKSWY